LAAVFAGGSDFFKTEESVAGVYGGGYMDRNSTKETIPASLSPVALGSENINSATLSSDLSPFFKKLAASPRTHIVSRQETWQSIAKKYGIDEESLRASNPGSSLSRGTKLIIPLPLGVAHKIEPGEKIERIAAMYGVGVEDLRASNPDVSPYSLAAGSVLMVPSPILPRMVLTSANSNNSPKIFSPKLTLPTNGHNWGVAHDRNAVDIANSCGSDVIAAEDGVVVLDSLGDGLSGWNGGYGKFILLSHKEEYKTRYAHLSEIFVSLGDKVSKGQLIGRVGTTGQSSGCHLHFEVIGAENIFIKK